MSSYTSSGKGRLDVVERVVDRIMISLICTKARTTKTPGYFGSIDVYVELGGVNLERPSGDGGLSGEFDTKSMALHSRDRGRWQWHVYVYKKLKLGLHRHGCV